MKAKPELVDKVEEYKNDISNLDKEKDSLQSSKQYYIENLAQLKKKHKDLEEKIISDDEYINLLQ